MYQIAIADGRLFVKNDPAKGETYADILARHHLEQVEVEYKSRFYQQKKVFQTRLWRSLEVCQDPDFGTVRVTRYTGVFANGRVLNQKIGRCRRRFASRPSQFIGSIIMDIGIALMEKTVTDQSTGRVVTRNLADYHVPVSADIYNSNNIYIVRWDSTLGQITPKRLLLPLSLKFKQ
ncbi:molybdopterin cofactor-binding domain-containing protein [Nostoc sp.]|uniref:molybdopterin cofactor-binding domain-containing protein n=1 Tax=Nostoc sp. TaxID=1180 RepID=UPI003FA6000B